MICDAGTRFDTTPTQKDNGVVYRPTVQSTNGPALPPTRIPAPPHSPLFDDAWAKWAWARERSNILLAEVRAVMDSSIGTTFTTRADYLPAKHCFSVVIDTMERLPDRWGLQYGEALHSYRSALDSAAWGAVNRGTRPPPLLKRNQRRSVAFPSCDTYKKFALALESKIPGVARADLAVVRRAQPYRLSVGDRKRSLLALLVEANNLDKHKALQPVTPTSVAFISEQIEFFNCILTRIANTPRANLAPGTELLRVFVRRTGPDPQISVRGQLAAGINVTPGVALDPLLASLTDWVRDVLLGFSAPPADLDERILRRRSC